MLKKLYAETATEISNLVILLEERQEASETVTNFLSRLRVKAYKLMGGSYNKEEKEQHILHAFINGLRDKRISKAVEIIKPDDSESALFVAKKEEMKQRNNQEKTCFAITDDLDSKTITMMKEMSIQIKLLSEQVTFLTNIIKRRQEPRANVQMSRNKTYAEVARGSRSHQQTQNIPPYQRRNAGNGNAWNKFPTITCWNCDGNGHSWRNCSKRLTYNKCSSVCHITRFCRAGGNALRYFDIEENNEIADVNSSDEKLSRSSENSEEVDCLVMLEKENTTHRSSKTRKPSNKINVKDPYHRNIEEWVDYVNGKSNAKPPFYNPTVISRTRTEKATNKPLVQGKCGDKSTPILIDSGAALNVIDESFVRQLGDKAKIKPENLTIRCANNEKVSSLGSVVLKTSIGRYEKAMCFSVIPNLFPKVIIGLRQMKNSGIVIDAQSDAIWIRREKVPFISKTQSLVSENQ